MRVMLVGDGGREEALVEALHKSVFVDEVVRVSDPTVEVSCAWCDSKGTLSPKKFVRHAQEKKIDLVVIGPEQPLVAGVADVLREVGIPVFGPSEQAAELEGSKISAKLFCKAYGIPTADFDIAETPEQAKRIVRRRQVPIVIKQDGLARGKGVKFAYTYEEAHTAIDDFFRSTSSSRLLIEESLVGMECSYIVYTDGTNILPLRTTRDHKETHSNSKVYTGGMGCRTLTQKEFSSALEEQIQETIVYPTLEALRAEGRPFTGALYAGVMIVNGFSYVLEFNCRLGNPETQTIIPLLLQHNSDIVPYLFATTNKTMNGRLSPWGYQHSVCVVLAAEGYPGKPRMGDIITGIDEARQMEGVYIYTGGAKRISDNTYITISGHVVDVVCVAKTVERARTAVYEAVQKIRFDGMWYRKDI